MQTLDKELDASKQRFSHPGEMGRKKVESIQCISQVCSNSFLVDNITLCCFKSFVSEYKMRRFFNYAYYPIVSLVVLLLLIGGLALFTNGNSFPTEAHSDFFSNVFFEFIGIVLTVFILEKLQKSREQRREDNEEKERLVRELGTKNHSLALKTIRELRERGWLKKELDTLQGGVFEKALFSGADLRDTNLSLSRLGLADLSNADLCEANLAYTELYEANLTKANLTNTNLEHAMLWDADLSDANLRGANLSNSNLAGAKLINASLVDANLSEANLDGADLSGANLGSATLLGVLSLNNAIFDENTILPDTDFENGNFSIWDPEVDVTQYTRMSQ